MNATEFQAKHERRDGEEMDSVTYLFFVLISNKDQRALQTATVPMILHHNIAPKKFSELLTENF